MQKNSNKKKDDITFFEEDKVVSSYMLEENFHKLNIEIQKK